MQLVSEVSIAEYRKDDITSRHLDLYSTPTDEDLVCQRWLRESLPKRYIYQELYGSLFEPGERVRVLDIGGGLTGLTAELARRHDYYLLDLLAHDHQADADSIAARANRDFILAHDWAQLEPEPVDIVIANDIFPNVDQRLEMFLRRFLPNTRRMRLSLTYYDEPRAYLTRRIDADEILCMLAWNGEQLRHTLEKFSSVIVGADMDIFTRAPNSVFPNGRQVCIVELNGGLQIEKTE
jgi:hypothetical protein